VLAYSAILRAIEMVGRQNVTSVFLRKNREILDIINILPSENVFVIRNRQFSIFLLDIWRSLLPDPADWYDATVDMEFFARASAILSFSPVQPDGWDCIALRARRHTAAT